MPAKKATARRPAAKRSAARQGDTSDVDAWMQALDHPLKAEMEAVRAIIRGARPGIAEGIKWNAPSYSFGEHFATFNPRARDCVQVIFHLGARAKDNSTAGLRISDPAGLLEWLASERASVKLFDMKGIRASQKALESIVREWTTYLA